jgi:exoribonuclease R
MLPTIIGEELCSLDKEQMRFGFVLDFMVSETKPDYYEIDYESMVCNGSMHQCVLKVSENFDYEETGLLKNKHYKLLFDISKKLDKNIQDSHEMVAFWMLKMNHFCARQMKEKRIGIFRVVESKNLMPTTQESILQKLPPFVKMLEQQLSGSYKVFDADKNDSYSHEMLGLSEYIHFTSPIRRLVDLLNQIQWVIAIIRPTALDENISRFFKNQIASIDLLNQKMKKIRRLQSECDMLYQVTHDPSILEREYTGIVLNIENNNCSMYFEELKWLTNVAIDDTMVLSKYEKLCGKLYVFENEEQMRKKIRVQLIRMVD